MIPLHSQFRFRGVTYTALDTGSYIKGRHIDIWMRDCRAALNYGVRHIIIELIRKERHNGVGRKRTAHR